MRVGKQAIGEGGKGNSRGVAFGPLFFSRSESLGEVTAPIFSLQNLTFFCAFRISPYTAPPWNCCA